MKNKIHRQHNANKILIQLRTIIPDASEVYLLDTIYNISKELVRRKIK
jgi:hypothetical protein